MHPSRPRSRVHLDTTTIASKGFPRPTTKEWGEGQGEGSPKKPRSRNKELLTDEAFPQATPACPL